MNFCHKCHCPVDKVACETTNQCSTEINCCNRTSIYEPIYDDRDLPGPSASQPLPDPEDMTHRRLMMEYKKLANEETLLVHENAYLYGKMAQAYGILSARSPTSAGPPQPAAAPTIMRRCLKTSGTYRRLVQANLHQTRRT